MAPMTEHNDAVIDDVKHDSHHEEGEGGDQVGLPAETDSGLVITSAFAGQTGWPIIKKFWRLYSIGLAASLGGMYAGYCISAAGNVVANVGFIEQFGTVRDPTTGTLSLDAQYVSFWGGFYYVAQVVFQALSPFVTDRYGRKAAMWALCGFMLIAIILECVAKDWKVYLVAKIFAGIATAFLGTAVMTYMSEIAIAPIRGAMLGAFSFTFALGQFFNAIGLQILNTTSPYQFRNAFYSEFVIFGIFAIVVVFLPESPTWLCLKGKHEQAKRSLHRLVGQVDGFDLDHEYAVIRHEVEDSVALADTHGSNDWAALFKWVNFKRCLAATLPLSYQNFVGVPLVFGYTTYFFEIAGLSDAFLGTVIVYCILLLGIACSFYFVERVGRRAIVLGSGAFMAVIDAAIGGLGFKTMTPPLGAGLIALCSIWVFTYALSLAPIGWISLVELSTPRLRAKTAAVAAVLQSFNGILFSYTVPLMLSAQYAGWGTKIGLFFAGTSVLCWVPCYFLFPESKNRTYAELDELYERGISPRKFASTKTSVQLSVEAAAGQEGKA